jgi:hypothetical protein
VDTLAHAPLNLATAFNVIVQPRTVLLPSFSFSVVLLASYSSALVGVDGQVFVPFAVEPLAAADLRESSGINPRSLVALVYGAVIYPYPRPSRA